MDKIKEITNLIKDNLQIFEQELKILINQNDNFLKNNLSKFLFSAPKRLRPLFVYLFAGVLDIEDEKVLKIALVSELIHNASLVHDDIIDNEKIRRNQMTFNEEFGSKIAVLEGDLLLSIALKVLSGTSLDILKIYSDYVYKTINGEIEQNSLSNKIVNEEIYFNKTLSKTANLFLCGLESLFTLKEIDISVKNNLSDFMRSYSMAFQIKNDIDNILYNNSTDIENGNYTLPVIYFCLEKSYDFLDDEKIKLFKNNTGMYAKKAKQKMLEYKENALRNLNQISESKYKQTIVELVEYTLRSSF